MKVGICSLSTHDLFALVALVVHHPFFFFFFSFCLVCWIPPLRLFFLRAIPLQKQSTGERANERGELENLGSLGSYTLPTLYCTYLYSPCQVCHSCRVCFARRGAVLKWLVCVWGSGDMAGIGELIVFGRALEEGPVWLAFGF